MITAIHPAFSFVDILGLVAKVILFCPLLLLFQL
jgi:hypothetical protein